MKFKNSSQAETSLNLMYYRYTKHLLGWKKASENRLNQKFLLQQMQECVRIFSTRNLHLCDLSDSQGLDATKAKTTSQITMYLCVIILFRPYHLATKNSYGTLTLTHLAEKSLNKDILKNKQLLVNSGNDSQVGVCHFLGQRNNKLLLIDTS